MTDMTTEYYYLCETAEFYETLVPSSTGTKPPYHVKYDLWSHKYTNEVQYDWSCTCPHYVHRCNSQKGPRYCKHIEQARRNYCGWQQFEDGGEPVHDEAQDGKLVCPQCGSDVQTQGYAV